MNRENVLLRWMFRLASLAGLLCGLPSISNAQNLQLDSASFVAANYGRGNDVAVLFKASGCFGQGNVFELVLSDANGQFSASSPVIGSSAGYYATYVNGMIPATASASQQYRLMLRSTNPSITTFSPVFSIEAAASQVRAAAGVAQPLRVLRPNQAFGFCTSPIVPQQLALTDNSTSGATISGRLKDDYTGLPAGNFAYNAGAVQNVPLDRSYYTYLVVATRNGQTSTRAYSLINSRNRIILGVDGEQTGCLPQELEFQVGIDAQNGGIQENFPGTEYLVEWGDNTSTVYRYCDLVANNGVIKHNYLSTSCNRPGVSYNITISVVQPWQSAAGCDRPQVTTKAKISKKPHAYFQLPDTGCQGSPILIRNVSDPGQQVFGQTCVSRADFFWYVNGQLVRSFFNVTPGTANLTHSFLQPGQNIVRLVVDNHSCEVNDSTDTICIEPRPIALATANGGQQSVRGCAPFDLVTANGTNPAICQPTTHLWQVQNAATRAVVSHQAGVFVQDSARHYRFLQPGRYWLILSASNFCHTSRDTIEVQVGLAPTIQWAATIGRCDTGWVNFADTSFAPKYGDTTLQAGVQWQVNGGAFQAANGFGLSTSFPQIRFLQPGNYNLQLQLNNGCGTANAGAELVVQARPTLALSVANNILCFNDSVPTLQAQTNQAAYDSLVWQSMGSGQLQTNGLQANYLASQADRVSGLLRFSATIYPSEKYCAPATDQLQVTVLPNPGRPDTALNLCSGLALPQRFANSGSVQHQFSSQLVQGQVNGLSPAGTGYPQDLLVNQSASQPAKVVYTFVATAGACSSQPFHDTILLQSTPIAQALPLAGDTICNGAYAGIQLSSSVPGVFRWASQAQPAGGVVGQTQQPVGAATNLLNDVLQATQTTGYATVQYNIWAMSTEGCQSAPVQQTIVVKPGNSAALAGPDQLLCNQASTQLQAQAPQLGQGQWVLLSGQATIAQPGQPQTQLQQLVAGDTARLVWQVSGHNGCSANSDTVVVMSRPLISPANGGNDQLFCTFLPNTVDSVVLQSQPAQHAWETGRWQMINAPAGAQSGVANVYASQTSFLFNQTGQYQMAWLVGNDAGCPEAVDTVQVQVFAKPRAGNVVLPAMACSIDTVALQTASSLGQAHQWQSSADGILFQNFTPLAGQQLLPSADSQWLRLIVRSEGWASGCRLEDTTATVLLSRVANTVPGILIGADTVCQQNNSGLVQLQQQVGQLNAWQMSTNGGQSWQTIAGNGLQLPYVNLAQTTLYRAEVQNSICPAQFTSALPIIVHGGVQSVSISQAQQLCFGSAAQPLQAQVNANGFGGLHWYWEESADSIQFSPISGATQLSFQPGLLGQTTWFRLQANASVCGSNGFVASPSVKLSIMPVANAGFALNTSGCAPLSLQPQGMAPNHSSLAQAWSINGQWVGNGGFPGHTIAAAGDSILVKQTVHSLAGCGVDSMSVWVATLPKAAPAFSLPTFGPCGPVTIGLQNNSLRQNDFRFQWSFGNGSFSNQAQPTQQTFDPHPLGLDTSYTIRLQAMNACDTASVEQTVAVKSKPKATFTPDKTTGCSPLTIQFSNTTLGPNQYRWNFGNGNVLNTTATAALSQTYTTGRVDTVHAQLLATNSCGSDSLRYAIVVQPSNLRIDLAVNGNEAAGCAPFAVRLINNSQNGHQFRWDFGDGQSLQTANNLDTVAHSFAQPGQYTVRLRGTNACTDTSTTETIFVGRRPVAAIGSHLPTICVGDSLGLQAGSDSANTYRWLLAQGSLQGAVIRPAFAQAGAQNILLLATRNYTNGLSCADTALSTVFVTASAPGKLALSDTAGFCGPLTVQLSHAHQGIAQTQWMLSNGQQKLGDTASFRLHQNGLYRVAMKATTTAGCQLVDSALVRLQSPEGSIQYNTTLSCGDRPVSFVAQFSGADSIRWDFGDGNSLTTRQATVQHAYASQGRFLPTATLVGNAHNCLLPMPVGDSIVVEKLAVQLSFRTVQDCGTTTLRFNDSASRINPGMQYFWRFGNGQTSNASSPQAMYTVANQYPIFLRMRTANGCADSVQQMVAVSVKAKPHASIGGDSSGCAGTAVRLLAVVNSADSIISHQWSGPNGFASAGLNPLFTSAQAGQFPIRLVVASSQLCYDTAFVNLPIRPAPQVQANADVLLCRGQQTTLQASGASTYSWSPSNFLSNASAANPVASPVQTQRYVVTGMVAGNACQGTDTVWVRVAQPIKTAVSSSDSICQGQVVALQANGANSYQWLPAAGLSSATVASPLASPAQTTRYMVVGRDSAGCFNDTAFVTIGVGRPIVVSLGADRSAATGDKIKLQPTLSGGTATQFQWTGAGLDCNTCAQPTLTVQGSGQIVLKASSAYGCQASDTLAIKGFCESTQVFIANAFTPDNDGRNDYLFVQGKGISMVKSFRVFNRWGQVVFERVNHAPNDARSGWDGRIKGQPAGTDVYVYTAEVVCDNNVAYTFKGNSTLIR